MNDLSLLFACPVCKGALNGNACSACNIDFSRGETRVPSFLCKEMYESEASYQQALRTIEFWGNGWGKRLQESEHAFIYAMSCDQLYQYAAEQIDFGKRHSTLMGQEIPIGDLHGKVVLNIGCGAGTEALTLAHAGAQCIAMDITNEAACAADLILDRVGGGLALQGDARFIPLKDSSVDIVYSSGVLHHSSDIEKSIKEILRVLKPGGTAYVMLYAKWSIVFLQEKLLGWTGEQAWETGDRKNPRSDVFSVQDCRELFSDFSLVSVDKRGGSLRQIAKIGKLFPKSLDFLVDKLFGANLNIVATKKHSSRVFS